MTFSAEPAPPKLVVPLHYLPTASVTPPASTLTILDSEAAPPPFPYTRTYPIPIDERNKAAPWRPPGSPGSVNVVATSVAAAAAASAAMARPAIDVRRRRSSGGTSRRSSTGRQTGRRVVPPEEELFHGGGGGERDEGGPGPGYGEEESPRSAGGAYEEWLAGAR